MSETPICDFVRDWVKRRPVRLHMPGHKGVPFLGCEPWDITEIDGADTLYAPQGIIAESEAIASMRFGCRTFYSAEGSSLCIRAMLYLAQMYTGRSCILAQRSAHKTFLYAAALLNLDVHWLHPHPQDTYYSCTVTAQDVEAALQTLHPCAVYLTAPDYLGNSTDISAIAQVCRRRGVLLLLDNAHGAYLHFLQHPLHPMDLGADMCCDSAHKTLPVLTGGAYLHLSDFADIQDTQVKEAFSVFGSTSPSYLILQSLDRANLYLQTYPERLAAFVPKLDALKADLVRHGYSFCGGEPLKWTIRAKPFGYTGDQLAAALMREQIFCEMHDPDHLVCMFTPENTDEDLLRLHTALLRLPRRTPLTDLPPVYHAPQQVMSVRDACFARQETLPVRACIGRVMADAALSCPPAVPIVLCGERIDTQSVERLCYYGVQNCTVVR